MQIARACIYPFPPRHDTGNLLTLRDKLDLHEVGDRITRAGFRCVIGRDREGICHDFVHLDRSSEPATCWTLVRSGAVVRAWRGTHGADLGAFPSLREAMTAVLDGPGVPAPPLRRPSPPTVLRRDRTPGSKEGPKQGPEQGAKRGAKPGH